MRELVVAMVLWAGAGIGLAGPGFAEPTDPTLAQQFAQGDYLSAASVAEASGTPDDLAFAARSLLAKCMTGPATIDADLLDRAYQNAAKAVSIDRGHIEGRLQLAIAASLQTRSMGLMEANRSGLGKLGRLLAEGVLEDDPGNYYAHGFIAVWHIEVRRRAGGLGAMMAGVSLDDARAHYAEAARLAPDDVGVHWSYGRALVALDAKKYRVAAEAALRAAVAADAGDHVEEVMQGRAQRLLDVLVTDRAAAERLALELL